MHPYMPYSVVQIDGHRVDALFCVEAEDEYGNEITSIATRMWLIAVIDMYSRCILGYSISYEENYNKFDVLRAIKSAIMPKTRPVFTRFTDINSDYPEQEYPDVAMENLQYALPNMIMLDNAKSHLAIGTLDKLVDDIGCALCFGSVATPETRGIVERTFGTLEKNVHRLPMTTGSSARDTKRNDPEKAAVKYNFRASDLEEVIAITVAIYNTSANSGIQNLTPVSLVLDQTRRGMFPSIASEETIKKVQKFEYFSVTRTVSGSQERGRRPYVTFEGYRYRGDILSSSFAFLGKKIILHVQPDDISHIDAYEEDGAFIETLTAAGFESNIPRSIKTQRLLNKKKKENAGLNPSYNASLPDLEAGLRKSKAKRDRTRAEIIRKESKGKLDKKDKPTVITPITPTPSKRDAIDAEIDALMAAGMSQEEIFKRYKDYL